MTQHIHGLEIAPETETLGRDQRIDTLKKMLDAVGYHPHPNDLEKMADALTVDGVSMFRRLDEVEHLVCTVRMNIEQAQADADKGVPPIHYGSKLTHARRLANEFIKASGPEDFEAVKELGELASRRINRPRP